MFRVLPLLLLIGTIALAPLAVPAQDKDKDKVEEKKVEEKKVEEKKVEEKKVEETPKVEPKTTPVVKSEEKSAVVEVIPSRLDYALGMVPLVSLVLIAILFVLVLSLRSSVSQLEEKVKGS